MAVTGKSFFFFEIIAIRTMPNLFSQIVGYNVVQQRMKKHHVGNTYIISYGGAKFSKYIKCSLNYYGSKTMDN